MRPGGVKSSRPTGLATADVERDRMVNVLVAEWKKQAAQISERLNLKAMEGDVATAVDVEAMAKGLAPTIQALMYRMAEIGAWEVLEDWNPDAEGWGPEMVEAWIAKAAATNARRWATGVQTGLNQAITQEEPEKAVRSFLAASALAGTLAWTFATEARSFGATDAARKSGLKTKTWHTNSKKPRPEHAALSGMTIGIDETFPNGVRWPGDHAGDAEDNANCRCTITYGREDQ